MNNNIVCVYDGVSSFNNQEILYFLYLGHTQNKKLGDRYKYTVVIPKEEGIQSEATCRNCKLMNDSCYVNHYMRASYRKWRKQYNEGLIEKLDVLNKDDAIYLKRRISGYLLRFCVSGDPLSVPYEVNRKLIDIFGGIKNTIMYSHFKFLDERYKDICYQSCESRTEGITARILPYTTKDFNDNKDLIFSTLDDNEVLCPAQTKNINCSLCRICRVGKKSVAFLSHGNKQNKLKTYIKELV